MSNVLYSFFITSLAGFSTLLGSLLIFLKKVDNRIIAGALSFAAGVMTCVSVIDLIPSSFELISSTFYEVFAILLLLTFFVIGVIFSMLIDKYLPDGGGSNLYKLGIFSMIAIILHNLPEGILTYMATSTDRTLGLTLAIAIGCHNIPEGITVSMPIYYSTGSRRKAFFYTFISGISEPIGAVLAYLFLSRFVNDLFMGFLFAFIAGIMMHISIYELLPTSLNYKEKRITWLLFFIGILFMYISHQLL